MDKDATGRFIAELRKEKGYTQKELAEKLMVTDKAISRWETGKGLPDTSLLKPLGDILGVSVGELLSGRRMEEAERKRQADRILLESLDGSKRLVAGMIKAILLMIGIALILSPLFLATRNFIWILGFPLAATALLAIYIEKKGVSMKTRSKAYFIAAIAMECAALILEILPVGAVMVFAVSPSQRVTEVCSYFSLLPLGYAHFTPMLTGILTIATILLGIMAVFRFDKAPIFRKAAFGCSAISLLLSITPLFLFGTVGMTAAGYAVCGAIFLSLCLQAAANPQK